MRAHSKTHPINSVSTNSVMITNVEKNISAQDMIDSICGDLPKWAVMLKGLRGREGLTQKALGKLLEIEQSNISKMELGKRTIGKSLAKKLASLFKTDYRLFL